MLLGGYDIQSGRAKLGQTFRDYLGHAGERPHKRIFWKKVERLKLTNFWEIHVGFVKDCEEGGKVAHN